MKDDIFGNLLSTGIKSIAARQGKSILSIEDEIGLALNREGRSAVEYWRKGNIPDPAVVEFLARECVSKGRLDFVWANEFLSRGRVLDKEKILNDLFPVGLQSKADSYEGLRVLSDWDKSESIFRHNLPPRGEFVGRVEERKSLTSALLSRSHLVAVEGISGVGKSALVLEICYELISEWQNFKKRALIDSSILRHPPNLPHFTSIVWHSARISRGLLADNLLNTIARVLMYPKVLSLEKDEKYFAVIDLLRSETTLLVIDNLELVTDITALDFLRDLPEPSKAILTSSRQIFHDIKVIKIHGLTYAEANLLFENELLEMGEPFDKSQKDNLFSKLYEITEGVPLAIKLAVRQTRKGRSLERVVNSFYNVGGNFFEQAFSFSWSSLSDVAKQSLMAAAIWPTPLSREALASAINVNAETADAAISQLIELLLLETSEATIESRQRYRLHTLIRTFAANKTKLNTSFAEQVSSNLANYFLQYAEKIYDTWVDFNNRTKLDDDHDNFIEATEWFYENTNDNNLENANKVIHLVYMLADFQSAQGYWNELIHLSNMGIECTQRINALGSTADFLSFIGEIHLWRGEIQLAQKCILNNLSQIADFSKLNTSQKLLLAKIAASEGNLDEAETLLLEMLTRAELSTDKYGRPAILVDLGIVATMRGSFSIAQERFAEALRLDEQLKTIEGQSVSISNLANATMKLGEIEMARNLFERGLYLAEQVSRISTVGQCRLGLGEIFAQMGDWSNAKHHSQIAFNIFQRLGMAKESEKARNILASIPNI